MGNIKCSRDTSFAFFILHLVVFIAAYATPFWNSVEGQGEKLMYWGLFMICVDLWEDCERIDDNRSEELKATLAMMSIALACYAIALVVFSIWVSKSRAYLNRHGVGALGISALVLVMVGGIFNLIGVAIYGAHYQSDLLDEIDDGWKFIYSASFISAAIVGIGQVLNSVITLIVMMCTYRSNDKRKSNTQSYEAAEEYVSQNHHVATAPVAMTSNLYVHSPQQGFSHANNPAYNPEFAIRYEEAPPAYDKAIQNL